MTARAEIVDAAVGVPTAAEMAAAVREGGYRLTAEHAHLLVGERPIPGHPGAFRTVLCYRPAGILPWIASLFQRRLTETEPLTFDTRFLHHHGPFADVDAFGLWLGGVSSVPVDRAEVRAIEGDRAHGA